MLLVEADQSNIYSQELFGPIIFLVRTKDTTQSIELAASLASEKGALTCGAYTTDEKVEAHIRDAMEDAYTQVSFNLTGFIWINQAAGFSDFHVSGGNPAGNATFANPEYANKRFVWVQHRKLRC
jgi:acyl-CoA reductase-like NAD-dependent aldehyde dehydrogenase